jgi:hypothetical protein
VAGGPIEKGRGAIALSTGSYISLVLLGGGGEGGDVTRVEGVDTVEGVGGGGFENTIMTECTEKSAYLVEGLWHT